MYKQQLKQQESMQERRKFPRVEVDYVTVEIYSELTRQTDIEICSVVNVSEDGMRFKGEQNYDIGQHIRLTFILPESMVVIRTDAEIINKSESNRGKYAFGVQYKKLGLTEQRMIRHFIDKALTEHNDGTECMN